MNIAIDTSTGSFSYLFAVKALETELGGHTKKAAMHMLEMKLKPYEAIAKLIRQGRSYNSFAVGIGINNLALLYLTHTFEKPAPVSVQMSFF